MHHTQFMGGDQDRHDGYCLEGQNSRIPGEWIVLPQSPPRTFLSCQEVRQETFTQKVNKGAPWETPFTTASFCTFQQPRSHPDKTINRAASRRWATVTLPVLCTPQVLPTSSLPLVAQVLTQTPGTLRPQCLRSFSNETIESNTNTIRFTSKLVKQNH